MADRRLIAASLLIALCLGGVASTAGAATTPAVSLGMEAGSLDAASAAGAPMATASFWIGQWTASSGWGALDSAIANAQAKGATPLVYWYYWGDSISPSCVDSGCSGKSRAQWDSMTATMADHIRQKAGGRTVLVVLENEFNKNGIDGTYAPTFDAYLEAKANALKAVPGVKVILGYGSWGETNWGKFPRAMAASDAMGFQLMRASTKDSESSYRGAPDKIASVLSLLNGLKPGKGVYLYDLALSSYPDSSWAPIQAQTLGAILSRIPEYAANGLQGISYRELRDNPSMGTANYYGVAEQHWGLRTASNAAKASWDVWTKAFNDATPPPPPPPPANRAPTASFTAAASGLTASVDGSSSSDPDGDALSYAWSFGDGASASGTKTSHAYGAAGSYTVTLTVSDGTLSSTTTRTVSASTPAPVPTFAATFEPHDGNAWWVQARVLNPTQSVSAVCARVDGGACQTLTLRAWGSWANSFNVPAGAKVVFTAIAADGQTVSSGEYVWGTPPPPPAPGPTATFAPYEGNAWWVQTRVTASGTITAVCATVNGGACQALKLQSWGAWAASFNAPVGSKVVFKATTATGVATSSTYVWPVK